MPKSCEAVYCTNHNFKRVEKLSFFKLPSRKKSPERRDKWLNACQKLTKTGGRWSPGKHAVLCSKHFVTGAPVLLQNHPDYIPSIFPHKPNSTAKGHQNLKRFQRKEKISKRRLSFSHLQDVDKVPDPVPLEDDFMQPPEAEQADEACQQSSVSTEEAYQCKIKKLEEELLAVKQERNECREEFNKLQEDCQKYQEESDKLKEQLEGKCLSSKIIQGDDKKCRFFTGLPLSVYVKTFEQLRKFVPHATTKDSLSYEDQFFFTLVRLRLDLSFEFLAYQTGVAESTIRGYFWLWIDMIFYKLDFMLKWPSRESISATLPSAFRKKFPRLTSIIDCFEIFMEQPKNLHARAQVYSNYKKHTTVKVFIACTPLGAVCYLSPAWGGRVSDVELVRQSGFIDPHLHEPGDQILADRGFLLHDDFATVCSAELITPAFTRGKSQLSAWDVEKSRGMSSIRIHVERVIGLMKNRYTILQNTLSVSMVKSRKGEADGDNLSSIDRLLRVCGILVNLGGSIVFKD
ncbi:uncharacterized protein LOC115921180 [Strongylocentrotus purpuratus]|uniref:THAP-type domain-containing protein n=1 Tax=Strongylocentrotus purpuratus TaxID=7668 RepID=A0A7M7NBQ5_STRPU|nr:uncharacterized protein LOC115921180 [Strongylocentrotus purpuratus]